MTREMLLVGADMGDRSVWTWHTDGGGTPRHHTIERSCQDTALRRLAGALPDRLDDMDSSRLAEPVSRIVNKCVPRAQRSVVTAAVLHSLIGELSEPDREIALARALADVFLPEQLAADVADWCSAGEPGLLRIFPPASAFALPWELLPVGDQRLVGLVDVVHVPPPLRRDGTDVEPQPWDSGDRVLQVVDPVDRRPVLPTFPAGHPDGWPDADAGKR